MKIRNGMKKNIMLLVIALTAVCAVVCVELGTAASSAKKEKVYFYTLFGWGKEADAQYSTLFQEFSRLMKEELKIETEYKYFKSEDEFFKQLAKPGPKFAIVGRREQLVRAMSEFGYEPFVTYEVYGLKSNRICLYTGIESEIDDVSKLAGTTLGMYDEEYAYYALWEIVGVRPDKFFRQMEVSKSSLGGVYLFSMGEVKSVLVTDQMRAFLKENNPALASKLKKLACAEPYTFMPTLKSKDVSEDMVKKVWELLSKVSKGKRLKQYSGVLRLSSIELRRVTAEDYKSDFETRKKALEAGWDKAYMEWQRSIEEQEKQSK